MALSLEAARRSAAFVFNMRRAGQAARRRRAPAPRFPVLVERDYATDLVAILATIRKQADEALVALPALLESARREREDSDELLERTVAGLRVVIENPVGSVRTWKDADGTTGTTVMLSDYGYLLGYEGADGEDVDVYRGPVEDPAEVYVVHQRRKGDPAAGVAWTEYDEDKVMLGFASADAARAAYAAQYDDERFFGGMSVFGLEDFKQTLHANPGRKLSHADPRDRRRKHLRVDVGEGRRARALLDRARDQVGGSGAPAEQAAAAAAAVAAKDVADHQRGQLGKQSTATLGVDLTPLLTDPKMAARVDAFVHENVSLIKTLGTKTLDDLEKMITRAFADGQRAEQLGPEIAKRWGIAERHARLIARDQIGKLNGQITRARHKELGIATFRWLTMKDPKVRPRHQPMEGKTFAYEGDNVPPFWPGQEICCRCVEEPIFDDIMAELDKLLAAPAPLPPAPPPEDAPAYQLERERQAAASRAAVAAANEDLAAFSLHQAKEKEWAAKVQAAKEKQAKALADFKAKQAAEQAAKDAKIAAEKAAAELAAKKAAEEAAKKAEEAAAAAKKLKLSEAAKKAAATKKANKEAAKLAAEQAAAQAAAAKAAEAAKATAFKPHELAAYQAKITGLQTSANTTPPVGWSTEKHAAQAAAKSALQLHASPTTPAEMLKAADEFEAVAAKAKAAGSYWGTPYSELAQELRDRVTAAELEEARAARRAARAARAPAAPAQPIRYGAMKPDDFNGFHGQGFVQDADAIEGGSVRVLRVQGHDGSEYYEAVFKVTAPYGEQARAFGTAEEPHWPFRGREMRNGRMVDLDPADGHASSNRNRVRKDGGHSFEIGLDGALANQVRVRAGSLDELDKAMGKFSRHIGAETQIEPTRADLELQAKARIAAKYDPKTYGALMKKAKTAEDQLDAIEQVFDKLAKKHPELQDAVEDAEIREVYPGHRTLFSETLGKTLAKKYGAMYHDGNPPAQIAAAVVGNTGLMSSAKRYHSGVFTKGMSTGTDFGTGGADGVFMRLSNGVPSSAGGKFRAVIDTEQIMGRLDWWAFNFDNYGTSSYGPTGSREGYSERFSVPEMMKGSVTSGNEVMAPQGVPPSAFKKFIVEDESYRKQVLAELARMGVKEINGKPADQFVVTR